MYRSFFKRGIDFSLASTGFICISPLFICVMICLYVANKGSVFFRQSRPGLNGKVFQVVKFKTMTDEKDARGKLLPDKDRLTKIGKFVRSTSLDELPQLLNVIRGDMSLIGPRPLLVKYLPLYTKTQARRHEVRPGITGWAQVNGRNAIGWEQKFEYDVWYVDHVSLALDVKIIFLTLKKVLVREGINAAAAATMPPFTGSEIKDN